jgi:hypothetical protein
MYLYYILWQWMAYRLAKKLNQSLGFYRAQHVSWGSIQLGSFLYRLDVPFIFGPAGGGQHAPDAFKEYFLEHWSAEEKRKKSVTAYLNIIRHVSRCSSRHMRS